jgi:hypothetical protein
MLFMYFCFLEKLSSVSVVNTDQMIELAGMISAVKKVFSAVDRLITPSGCRVE